MTQAPHRESSYREVRAVVTGATGFIGRWTARRLAEAGAHVFAFCRSAERAAETLPGFVKSARVREIDLTDADAVKTAIREIRPHVVFNLAGYGVDRTERAPDQYLRVNAEAVGHLLDALAAAPLPDWPGTRLLHAGTALEYGRASGDLTEDGPALPYEDYGRSKLMATEMLRRTARGRGITAITARFFTVYGPGEHAGRLLPTLLAARGGTAPVVLGPGTQVRDFTFVDDTVEGLLRLGESAALYGEIVNVATGRLSTVRAFVERAAAVLGIAPERLAFGAAPARAADEMKHDPVAVGKLRDLIGWVPSLTIEDGVRMTAALTA